jgi:hypothetical protein
LRRPGVRSDHEHEAEKGGNACAQGGRGMHARRLDGDAWVVQEFFASIGNRVANKRSAYAEPETK